MSFRKKIFISQLLLFFVFVLILFPFLAKTVRGIVHKSLEVNTYELIDEIKSAQDEKELIQRLIVAEDYVFFRVTLFNDKGVMLFDSHLERTLGKNFKPHYQTFQPEVAEALKKGSVYTEAYSQAFGRKLAYISISFSLNGQKYVLRTAFPYNQVQEMIQNFEIGFLLFCLIALIFFSVLTWFIFYRLSRPIQQIITAIGPYQRGVQDNIPQIILDQSIEESDDFSRLAKTLNSLSDRIQMQIRSITAERNEKEAILESLGEGVIAVDMGMVIRYANFIASKMLGIPKRHLLGKHFSTIEHKTSSVLIDKCKELLIECQNRSTVVTDSIALGEGKKLYLDLIAAPTAEKNGAIIVMQDKSSHYKVLEMGKDFVANASHELRTPITIIRGFAETLQDLPELAPDMLADITEKIVRNCQRMENLVKNLLTLADIENLPESRFQECDLVALIENCRHVLLSVYPNANVEIIKNKEYIIASADPDILELAITNLLDNAAKYSQGTARITVELEVQKEEVQIVISDQGIGIPAIDLEHIFERFYTVNKAHSRRLGGAGLGLSIVKTIIQHHDGTITVSSELGRGTRFTITLPLHRFGHSSS
jgi:two-component system phosphate regulon sensor histidine kinase PhoR